MRSAHHGRRLRSGGLPTGQITVEPAFAPAYDIEVGGAGGVPDGPAILAANHRSFMDSVFLAVAADRPVAFMARAEYFDRRRTAWIFRSTGPIPLRRGRPLEGTPGDAER